MSELESLLGMVQLGNAVMISLDFLCLFIAYPFALASNALNECQGTYLKNLKYMWDWTSKVSLKDISNPDLDNSEEIRNYVKKKKEKGFYWVL